MRTIFALVALFALNAQAATAQKNKSISESELSGTYIGCGPNSTCSVTFSSDGDMLSATVDANLSVTQSMKVSRYMAVSNINFCANSCLGNKDCGALTLNCQYSAEESAGMKHINQFKLQIDDSTSRSMRVSVTDAIHRQFVTQNSCNIDLDNRNSACSR